MTSDYEALRLIELSEQLAQRWRHGGFTPAPETYAQLLWAGVLAQFIVVRRSDNRELGLVSCYAADFQHGYAYFAATKFRPDERDVAFVHGITVFLRYVFRCWNFRKLYLEARELNLEQFQSEVGRLLKEEGRLRHHYYSDGQYWDSVTLALYRQDWLQEEARFMRLGSQ